MEHITASDRYIMVSVSDDGYMCIDIFDKLLRMHLSDVGYVERCRIQLINEVNLHVEGAAEGFFEMSRIIYWLNYDFKSYDSEVLDFSYDR